MPDITQYLIDCKFILVSNREPYEHVRGAHGTEVRQPAGGLVTALDPTMRHTHGTWVAWGSGSADHDVADETGRVSVPPDDPSYTLRRVWLDDADINGYYHGFANRALWPLCHIAHTRPVFRTEDWEYYKKVNQYFADAVLEETAEEEQPFVLIQDYHFALLPRLVKDARHGRIRIDLDLKRLDAFGDRVHDAVDRATIGIMTAALVIGSSIVMTVEGGSKIFGVSLLTYCGLVGYLIAFVNSLWIIFSMWRSGRR